MSNKIFFLFLTKINLTKINIHIQKTYEMTLHIIFKEFYVILVIILFAGLFVI